VNEKDEGDNAVDEKGEGEDGDAVESHDDGGDADYLDRDRARDQRQLELLKRDLNLVDVPQLRSEYGVMPFNGMTVPERAQELQAACGDKLSDFLLVVLPERGPPLIHGDRCVDRVDTSPNPPVLRFLVLARRSSRAWVAFLYADCACCAVFSCS
jgi:hypothetical protein